MIPYFGLFRIACDYGCMILFTVNGLCVMIGCAMYLGLMPSVVGHVADMSFDIPDDCIAMILSTD